MAYETETRVARGPRLAAYDVVRLGLGLVLIAAGSLKVHQLLTGQMAVDTLIASRPWQIGIAEAEWGLGLWLICGAWPRPTRRLSIACFAGFAGVSLARIIGGETSCGCFGGLKVNPGYTFAFDLLATITLCVCRPGAARSAPEGTTLRLTVFLTIGLWIGIPIGVLASRSGGELEPFAVSPGGWVGEKFPLLGHIDVAERIGVGEWKVVLYHHDCSRCREAIPAYERSAIEGASADGLRKVALIEIPPYGKPADAITSPGSRCLLGRLDDSRRWMIATPAEFAIREGIIVGANLPE